VTKEKWVIKTRKPDCGQNRKRKEKRGSILGVVNQRPTGTREKKGRVMGGKRVFPSKRPVNAKMGKKHKREGKGP